MKKFTGNFLFGEQSLGHVLRKIGLTMVAILMAVAVYAQAQETYHVWAESADDYCYRQDNVYEVDILMRDFVKIDTFVLVLDYDESEFNFVGVKSGSVHAVLASELDVEETTDGTLKFEWDSNDDPVANGTITPDDDTTMVFTLQFELEGYPHAYGVMNQFVFDTELEWDNSVSKFWNDYPDEVTNILTDMTTDGSLTVTQTMEEVVVDAGSADCFGADAIAEVTVPEGEDLTYSFNGSTFTGEAITEVEAPSTNNTVVVLDGECRSFIKRFDVEAPAELEYATADTVYTDCPGGLGDIEIFATGGKTPYTYYIVSEEDWLQVRSDLAASGSKSNANEVVEDYARVNNVLQRSPGIYYVAVQDDNQCQDLRTIEWWTEVEVIDDKAPWVVNETVTDMACYLGANVSTGDGSIEFDISGATPFVDGYNVWFDDTYEGRLTSFDSGTNLTAGEYDVYITDSLGCSWSETYVIEQPDPITFWADHTDASCEESNGTISIDTESITGGTDAGGYEAWWWIYSTTPNFTAATTDTISSINTPAEDLAPAVYYVRIFDDNDCFADFVNPNGDNAVKVLTTEFELVYDDILCNGGSTDVTIELVTGAGNHEFEYSMDGGTSTTSNVFTDISAGTYTFTVHDLTIDCELSWTAEITEPDPLMVEIVEPQSLPPTCPDNSDGNLTLRASGGTPFVTEGGVEYYEYKMDGDNVKESMYGSFTIDNEEHTFTVVDANGCETWIEFDWPATENIIELVDTIYNDCALQMVNLFNLEGEECTFNPPEVPEVPDDDFIENPTPEGAPFWDSNWWDCPEEEEMDYGAVEYFEWYGVPMDHFQGALTFDYNFWTSDSGWVSRTLQGVQVFRNPVLYVTDVDPDGDPQAVVDNGTVVGHNTVFGAGDYWAVVMDEWGCFSNIEPFVIMDPPALEIAVETVPAGCYGNFDGQILVEAWNGRFEIPSLNFDNPPRYEYVLTQQPQIFNQENWVDEVTWVAFDSGDIDNDSLLALNVKQGTYYLAVRDYCAVENTDLIQFEGPIVVDGADEVEVDWDIAEMSHITCNVWDVETETAVSANDGSITNLLAATTGGFGNYSFTLSGNEWTETNETGDFTDLAAGDYTLTVQDDSLGCQAVYPIEIREPDVLRADFDVVNASCFEAHDGLIRYRFYGGTAPYEEATNNVGAWENPSDIPEERWYNTEEEAVEFDDENHSFVAFDRRVRAGHYGIWVRDANGCIFGPVQVTVDQPEELTITDVVAEDVTCNDQAELFEGEVVGGSITFTPEGGWNIEEGGEGYGDYVFWYYAELWSGGSVEETQTFDVLPESITFDDLEAGDYTLKLYEYSDDIKAVTSAQEGENYEGPVTTVEDYFIDWHNWMDFAPFQNPNMEKCFVTYDVTVGEPDEITYDDIVWTDLQCHNEPTGEIYVPNITGGTPHVDDGYYVGLEGPADYDPSMQSNFATHEGPYDAVNEIQWFTTNGANEFTFDNLTWGHYTVHIMDGNDCWIYKESGEIENPDTLEIEVVELVENALCYGGEGTIQIDAAGGVGNYMYAVDSALVPHPGAHTFPNDLDLNEYLDGLEWQESDTFQVTSATWIGYVKDENGCIAGFSTFEDGAPVYHHRTTVLQPDPIEADGFGQEDALCYGEANGKIFIDDIWGGNGATWTIEVSGTDYDGNAVFESFTKSGSSDVELTGLLASTNETDPANMTADDWYTIVIYDSEGCVSEEYQQYVLQPEDFEVVLKDKQNAFVCPDDKAGIFEIQVVSGGTPFGTGADGEPLYEYKWEAYEDEGYTSMIDSLTDDTYGFTKTFLGYAGIYYRVFAQDANGCTTERDTFIQAPEPIEFDVQRIHCYGEEMASARVSATGTEGRSFQVLYRVIEDETGILSPKPDWTVYNGWFTETIDIMDEFVYDDDNLTDYRYEFVVEDTLGCRSEVEVVTFDPVQHPLELDVSMVSEGECTSEVEVTVNGGIPPYEIVMNNDSVISEGIYSLPAGTYNFMVTDAHLRCEDMVSIDVTATPVVRDTMIEVYIGEDTTFVDAEAGVDTTLTEGMHTFTYMFEGCERVLNVEVVGVPRVADIATVQGEADESPWIGAVVEVTGTVTGIAQGEGFFMQDANAPWGGIWVAHTETATLQVGNGVTVIGEVAEVADVTTIQATEMTIVTPPLTVEPLIVEPMEAENEMYESVLVQVEGARATAADEDTGEWTIFTETDNDVVVNDWLFVFVPEEGHFYDVTGVVNGRLDAFKIEPRMEADIVDLTATPADMITENIEFKVYPNPFDGHIKIENNDKLTRVVISNIAGQRVMDVEYPSHEIRTANLVSGVYVVSMFTEDGLAKTERIVKR
ncbi:MAG: T9SS type A sorting domain-containing protein [Bacteroidota bacterium]